MPAARKPTAHKALHKIAPKGVSSHGVLLAQRLHWDAIYTVLAAVGFGLRCLLRMIAKKGIIFLASLYLLLRAGLVFAALQFVWFSKARHVCTQMASSWLWLELNNQGPTIDGAQTIVERGGAGMSTPEMGQEAVNGAEYGPKLTLVGQKIDI